VRKEVVTETPKKKKEKKASYEIKVRSGYYLSDRAQKLTMAWKASFPAPTPSPLP
jgi:hypothetical protein